MPLQGLANCSTSIGIPNPNRPVIGSRDDVPPIGRVGDGRHRIGVPLDGLTHYNTSLSIPNPNGSVTGSGNDLPPIGGIARAIDSVAMSNPFQWRCWP